MTQHAEAMPVLSFPSAQALREWLMKHHATSPGIWVRVAKRGSGIASVTFEELLDEGLCFGWSESMRRTEDAAFYLQRFTPRRTKGTQSQRNRERAARLISEGKMTPSGLAALNARDVETW